MRPHPVELRERVLAAYDDGMRTSEIAEAFHVSPAWARRVKQWLRERGHVRPLPHGGGRDPVLGGGRRSRLRALVRAEPDATLDELVARVRDALGVSVGRTALWAALESMGLPRKKSGGGRASRTGPT